ncbi:MAG: VWA domain-containing protein [Bryobacterales bacterium]|nr:VWA domain-containing protein [Bryobacterales bacterium]MEB2359839.1 VWA domain-containing protein [Bryobacterales bacterium]
MSFAAIPGVLCLFAALPQVQPPPEETSPTIQVDVDFVNILFSVRDKKGALIPNLGKEDFAVFEEGKHQEVKYFVRETGLPLTMGLLVDVSRSQENLIDIERRAAYEFFSQVLKEKDLAFLISFGSESELLQDFTGSPRLLQRGLEDLRVKTSVGGLHPGPVPTANRPKGTVLYDAVYLAATEKLRSEVGRKAIILITDGNDQGSMMSRDQAIEAAQRSDVIIYSIFYEDRSFGSGSGFYYSGDEGTLRRMSEETGGRVFRVDRKHTLDSIFDEIQNEMRSQYAIGYTPLNEARDGSFRRIEIRPKNKDLKVQARKGYYAGARLKK